MQARSVCWASLQPGPQRLAGLVKLADAVSEDLQSCYGIYASLFHRWGRGSPCCPCAQPLKCHHRAGEQGEQVSEVCPFAASSRSTSSPSPFGSWNVW